MIVRNSLFPSDRKLENLMWIAEPANEIEPVSSFIFNKNTTFYASIPMGGFTLTLKMHYQQYHPPS